MLAAEGLIELLPNRGARVRRFTETDVRNLFDVVAGLDRIVAITAQKRRLTVKPKHTVTEFSWGSYSAA